MSGQNNFTKEHEVQPKAANKNTFSPFETLMCDLTKKLTPYDIVECSKSVLCSILLWDNWLVAGNSTK